MHRMLSIIPVFALVLWSASFALTDDGPTDQDTTEASASPPFSEADLEFFEKEVRPILVNRCYECHAADAEELKGGFHIDSRTGLLEGGDTGPAIEPGSADDSLLIEAVRERDPYEMPPDSRLPDEEIAVLVRWIDRGAAWPPGEEPGAGPQRETFDLAARQAAHWAWHPLGDSPPPSVNNFSWCRTDIDRYILARLESEGITPAPPADRYALIRRVHFDLIGLPPSPEEIEAFVNDESPDAYEQLVDRLLASDHFGERWARHWLDVMRFSETHGHEFDYDIHHAWQYRDYLIRALNADVPYHQLVVEHLAGDLIAEPRRHPTDEYNESIIGTGFWYLGEAAHATTDVRGDEAGRIDNQIDTLTKAFLGITVGCARCHDHKFDAISTRDYYALAGYLQSSRRRIRGLDPHRTIAEARQQLAAIAATAASDLREALPPGDLSDANRFAEYLIAACAEGDSPSLEATVVNRWREALDATTEPTHPLWPWTQLTSVAEGDEAYIAAVTNARTNLDRLITQSENHSTEEDVVFATFDTDYNDWFRSGYVFGEGPTTGQEWESRHGGAHLARPGAAHSGLLAPKLEGVIHSPNFTIEGPRIHYHIAGVKARVRIVVDGYHMMEFNPLLFRELITEIDTEGQYQWITQAGDLGLYIGHTAYIEIIDDGDGWVAIDEIRFSSTDAPGSEVSEVGRAALAGESITHDDVAHRYGRQWADALKAYHSGEGTTDQIDLINWVLENNLLAEEDSALARLNDLLAERSAEMHAIASRIPATMRVLSITEGTPENEHVHIRGSHLVLGDEEPRHLPTALIESVAPRDPLGSGRLQLAEQIVDPANPLTARVYVNRVWHHVFGRGIVKTVDNFGIQGEQPTHPELLDHLANEFMNDGWSTKRLLRKIVLSNTYRMSSRPIEACEQADPENLLLHRMPIRRLEGEVIRDAILAVSGRLDRSLYGPSIPIHLTPFMEGRGMPETSGPLDGDGRRSIYTMVRRNFLSPFMVAFDTPTPFATIGRRNVSNVPAQSLILLNDPMVMEQAHRWAKEEIAVPAQSLEQRIEHMFLWAFGRMPDESEIKASLDFIELQGDRLGVPPEQRADNEALWADLCHVLFNVKEFIFLR